MRSAVNHLCVVTSAERSLPTNNGTALTVQDMLGQLTPVLDAPQILSGHWGSVRMMVTDLMKQQLRQRQQEGHNTAEDVSMYDISQLHCGWVSWRLGVLNLTGLSDCIFEIPSPTRMAACLLFVQL